MYNGGVNLLLIGCLPGRCGCCPGVFYGGVMKPVLIHSNVARTCFEFSGCAGLEAKDITIEIGRRGEKGLTVIYPALSFENGQVCFAWDKVLWNAKSGRYRGIIRAKGCKPLCVGLHIGCPCTMGKSQNVYFDDCAECA